MTPEEIEAFFNIHRDLPREGPGEAADVHWAVEQLGLKGPLDVLDAACGPGADTLVLAEALPEATITAMEKTPQFVTEARARIAHLDPRVRAVEGDMAKPGGRYDLIWCAGALYFLGVTAGLQGWRDALKPGGAVAFSEPVLLETPPSDPARAFWEEYPQITDLAGITAQVTAAGYSVQAHRMIVGAPWETYYAPMQARIDMLRGQGPNDVLSAALDENQLEIDRWRAGRDQIAYALLIVNSA
ncbi:class I SAM-dependent methyltransferase [uncultured Tateyamaria sp.]|uniref:class I SAM-dependent methyltransferase n=1 Tax=uncultured Tateyamaria sp. TaxID=455651 RepID=UPI00262CC571|nr:class I SAM-dependent methyltransferase [uncultured Tateyamaria sp.]